MRRIKSMRMHKKKQLSSDNLVKTYMEIDRDRNEENIRMMASFIRRVQFPVADICGLKSLIKDIPKGSEIYHYASAMNMCGTLLADMVNNMRLYYTISSDLHDMVESPYVFTKKIISTWSSRTGQQRNGFTRIIDGWSSDLECTLTIHKGVPVSVMGDSSYTHAILHNLLDNAIKFTPQGHVHASVRVTSPVGRVANIEISIEDTGVGISPKLTERIFEPLVKSHIEYMDGGSGMGLSVSRTICRSMGGDVVLERSCEKGSVGESGSIFVAHFPVDVNTTEVVTEPIVISRMYSASDDHEALKMDSTLGPIMDSIDSGEVEYPSMPNILVVDDVKLIRLMITKMIHGLSIVPDCAENGKDAIEMCKKKKYDMIIMDMIMPGINGIEASKRILSPGSLNQTTPIITMTASLDDDMRIRGTDCGILSWMSKPVSQKTLYSTMCNYLRKDHLAWIKEECFT